MGPMLTEGGVLAARLAAVGLAVLVAGLASGAERSTFAKLPEAVRQSIPILLERPSNEIPASPFATCDSFEVHGASEDVGVIETARRLGVKHIVMHNIHGSLTNPKDPRLTRWCDLCEKAGIQVRAILSSPDLKLWDAAFRNWGGRIKYWSYLNEPNAPQNNDHTNPVVKPEAYVAGLRAVRELRDRIAPDVKLGGPEVAMLQCMEEKPYPWLRLCIGAGLLGNIDFFTFHPYRQAYSPRNIPVYPSRFWNWGTPPKEYSTYTGQIAELRRRVGNKPLVVDEVGWSTTPCNSICEDTQAKFALRQQIQDFALGIRVAVYFLLRDRHVGAPFPQWHIENSFGIVHVDNTPKPAYTALEALYAQIDSRCKPAAGVPVKITVEDPPKSLADAKPMWYLFEDPSEPVPTLKLLYWLPVAAEDDFAAVRCRIRVGDVVMPDLPISDCPQILRVHQIDGRWGWPVRIDPLTYEVHEDVAWQPVGG